jgi:tRNA threonylcarbamoyladenosine biosynthesis protein TsaE
MIKLLSKSEDDTIQIGKKIGEYILANHKGFKIALNGELGCGKTYLIKGIVSVFIPEETVTSPTYTLINQYEGDDGKIIYHADLYRINKDEDLIGSGFYDIYENKKAVFLIEWANRVSFFSKMPTIQIKRIDDTTREIIVSNMEIKL